LPSIIEPLTAHWSQTLDVRLAQEQFDALKHAYVSHGVDVVELESMTPTPNLMFMRDLFTMTPVGAILARPASDVRAGEEVIVNSFLASQRIPVLLTVSGNAVFEGPDLLFFDSDSVFLAIGIRTNEEAARQVSAALELQGIRVVKVETTYGCGHLDGVLSIVAHKTAVVYPKRVSYRVYDTLKQHGYKILHVPDIDEADQFMAINMVALEPAKVLVTSQSVQMIELLGTNGVETIPVDVSEIMKAGGAMHCLTGVLQRDLV
jgi:N-dimethylarginine dimethylaminohydrolase